MANSTTPANGAEKPAATKRTPTKRSPSKARTSARPATSTTRKASRSRSSTNLPKWLTIGASVTGAVVAVGATLFATRKEWLPRARQLGEWVEGSVHEQLENAATVRDKIAQRRTRDVSATTARFEPSGADAAFDIAAATN